jgi:hypothetical protein
MGESMKRAVRLTSEGSRADATVEVRLQIVGDGRALVHVNGGAWGEGTADPDGKITSMVWNDRMPHRSVVEALMPELEATVRRALG